MLRTRGAGRDENDGARTVYGAIERDGHLQSIRLPGLSRWSIRLDMLYRSRDRDDEAVRTIINEISTA
jgi:hypothetical protein